MTKVPPDNHPGLFLGPEWVSGIRFPSVFKALNFLIGLSFFGLSAVVLHLFFQYVGNAPYLATDDALVNISYSLSSMGRFGIPSGPLQVGNLSLRLDGFHNYGPWYFYVGAALSWLFGMSHEMQRAIHPLGILFIGALALFAFRRTSPTAAGAIIAALTYVFFYYHWPMVRPDIMVSVLAVPGIVAAGAAIRTNRAQWWFFAAFFFAAAISQHMIAWALAPGMILIWALVHFLEPQLQDSLSPTETAPGTRQKILISFLASGAGALLALIIHLVAIDFRLADTIKFITSYSNSTANFESSGGYIAVALNHFNSAWGGVTLKLKYIIFGGFTVALLLLAGLRWMPMSERRLALSILLPPVVVSLSYQLSLGFYGNGHAGYTILSHVTTIWGAGAAVAVIMHLLRCRLGRLGWLPELALGLLVVAGLGMEARSFFNHPSSMQIAASKWVNIEDYVDASLAPLASRERAWGTFIFGLQSGIRTDLLQLSDGMNLIQKIKPEIRADFAPEFLVIGYREQNDIARLLVKNPRASHLYSALPNILPEQRYELVQIVSAPPYGATKTYRRIDASSTPKNVPPVVKYNDGTSRQWVSRLLPALPVTFTSAGPVSFDLPYAGGLLKESVSGDSPQAITADLNRGVYLITASIARGRKPGAGSGVLIATDTKDFTGTQTELGYGFVPAPYFPNQEKAYLLVPHEGGPLYISQFDADHRATFSVIDVRPIEIFPPKTLTMDLPSFELWKTFGDNVEILRRTADAFRIIGNASRWEYQLASPPISIVPKSSVSITLPIEVTTGKLGIGILDGSGNWLLAPQSGTNNITFNTLNWDQITIVVANNDYDGEKGPVQFSLRKGIMEVVRSKGRQTYADELSLCHYSKKQLNTKSCL